MFNPWPIILPWLFCMALYAYRERKQRLCDHHEIGATASGRAVCFLCFKTGRVEELWPHIRNEYSEKKD